MRWLAASVVTVSALLSAACGGGSGGQGSALATPASATLAKSVQAAAANATGVHVAGTVTEGGQSARLDLSLTRSGDGSGTVSGGPAVLTFLTTGGKTYIKVTSGLLQALGRPSSVCARLCGKYVVPTASQAKSMTGGFTWSSLMGSSFSAELKKARLTGSGNVNGQVAWKMRTHDGSTLYVAARGTAYLLRAVPPAKQGKGHLDFSQWNNVTIPQPPPSSQTLTFTQLMS